MLPRIPAAVLRRLLPKAEREEILADLEAEFAERRSRLGEASARRWVWRQTLASSRSLVGWSWRRGWTGYESPANAYQPGGRVLKNWMSDVRYGARRLWNRPGYTVLAVLTLALGIGGVAAVFGIARPLLLDPLPYANAGEVGSFWRAGWWTEEEYLYLRDKFTGFRAVAAHRPGDVTLHEGDGPARLVPGIQASAELFEVLGAQPTLGRTFRTGDDVRGAEPVAVISYGLWQELGGQPDIIGKRFSIDGSPRTVVGVMPRGFWFPSPAIRIWTARALDPEGRNGSYTFIGRTEPGVDVASLEPQVARLTQIIGERFTYAERADKTKEAWVKPLREVLVGSMRPALLATLMAMILILLIACVNVTALMLGQVEGRSSELVVRSALGATRSRITQQLVVEALLVGVLAAVAGGVLASLTFPLLAQSLPIGAWQETATFDWTLFAMALGLAILAVLLVVMVSTFSLWRGNVSGGLSASRTGGIEGRGGRLERGLVVAEVALAMLIASGGALLVRSVTNLYAIDPGIETSGVAVVDVLSDANLPAARRIQKIDELILALGQLPGARSAAAALKIPLRGGGDSFGIGIEGESDAERTFTYFRMVSPRYFETMGIRVLEGRTFDESDLAPPADSAAREIPVVINAALAAKYFPGENPIGRRLVGGLSVPQRIIGIVADVAEASLTDGPEPTRYYMHAQAWFGKAGVLVIRTQRPEDAAALLTEARRTVERVAPEFAVQGTTTMSRVFDAAVGPARQVMSLLSLLSGLALVLGAVGIYGVIAHFAARRKRDWAIRVALGLPGSRVVTHVVRQGAVLAGIGIGLGALGAVALTRLLTSFLYGVSGVDPIAFAAAGAALLVIGLVAAFIPARRAGTVDPAMVLREQ
jgi:putative ABC transport system permease protein